MSVYNSSLLYPINTYGTTLTQVMYYNYKYDQLNRITRMDSYCGFDNTGQAWDWLTTYTLPDYKERVSYDANGNILKYLRNGTTQNSKPLAMDSLNYKYYGSSNQLRQVRDSVNAGNYTEDIDNQSDTSNYVYDEIGNLIRDKAESIDSIKWNVYGKIEALYKHDGITVSYRYDAAGNRIGKTVVQPSGENLIVNTAYVRDATGNVMSIYRPRPGGIGEEDSTWQEEIHLYGSSRLGIFKPQRLSNLEQQYGDTSGTISLLGTWQGGVFRRGRKFFELSNHLGNVLVTVNDRKQEVKKNDSVIYYYLPDIVTANDYYPFGMLQPERNFNASGGLDYRYGFNGKENDNEVKGEGNQQDYGMRIYDPRVGRFHSVDPLTAKFPFYTPYQFAGNKVIACIDLDGLEDKIVITQFYSDSKLNNSVTIKSLNPDGPTRSVNSYNDKEVVAHSLALRAQQYNPDVNIPTTGQFVFWEFPEHPEKNSASYYVRVDGKLETFTVSPQILKEEFDGLPNARANLGIAVAIGNLAVAGSLLKAELKAASGEVKAMTSETSADVMKGKFAQPNHSNEFSETGKKILGVQSIDQAVVNLKNGTWTAAKLPIDYVVRDGQVYYLNTRSIATLTEAGIPKSKWVFNNQTGVKKFENNLTNNLNGSSGYTEVINRETGKKTKL